ncbi:MAG: helix-turn-helix domain-containing protein [Fimbriimonadaceae bacterium]|nr:helix-turn-helix domain-containing protein [Chitinophagales bacterium]
MIYIVGAIITFFLVALLIGKKGRSTADNILAAWLTVTGFHLILYYLYNTNQYVQFPFLLGLEIPLPLAHGPFLFLYTAALTNKRIKASIRLLHFLPILIIYCFVIPFFTLSNEEKIVVYKNEGQGYEMLTGAVLVLIMLSGVAYVLLSLLLLNKHKKNISEQFSYSEKINLNWLRFLIWGTAAIWVCVIFGNDFLIYIFAVIYIILIGFFGIKQAGIFTSENLYRNTNHPIPSEENTMESIPEKIALHEKIETEKPKYQKSGLSSQAAESIHKQLNELMQQEKIFKNPELTLAELGEKLNLNSNYLSQVINTFEQKNFYDYVNQFRIEEFKHIVSLPENKQFTMLSLAFECGFNSKTSFNRNFKRVTGLSPSEFLQQELLELE